jgi:hypothetical protein
MLINLQASNSDLHYIYIGASGRSGTEVNVGLLMGMPWRAHQQYTAELFSFS